MQPTLTRSTSPRTRARVPPSREILINTTAKGALAAAGALVLLAGGAGSLAYWQASDAVSGDDLNSGRLTLVDPQPGGWKLNGATVSDASAVRIVPGDQLVWSGSFEVDAAGDNLQGDVAVTGGGEGGTLAPYVDTTAITYTIGGEQATTITEADDGERLAVEVAVDFPFGTAADNASQDKVLDVSDVSVTVTQTDATP